MQGFQSLLQLDEAVMLTLSRDSTLRVDQLLLCIKYHAFHAECNAALELLVAYSIFFTYHDRPFGDQDESHFVQPNLRSFSRSALRCLLSISSSARDLVS